MLKQIFTILFILGAFSQFAWAGPGHDGDAHDHNKPELIITPITPVELKAGEENEVVLFIQDAQATPVDISQFEVVHTQPVHLLVIEPGLADYHHEHPTQRAAGQYVFSFTPQTACSYRIWADVKLKGSHQHYIPIDLKGANECDSAIQETTSLKSSSKGYDFGLELDGDIRAGDAVIATMSITKDGEPVDFLEPVMGAFSHVIGFYEDYESIAHIHPMDKKSAHETERGGPALRFHIEPEHAGFLKLFAQVQIGKKQIFTSFIVKVEPSA